MSALASIKQKERNRAPLPSPYIFIILIYHASYYTFSRRHLINFSMASFASSEFSNVCSNFF